mmetsp:Transcript_48090/g.88095  ORF Transcript_48090/g.88095 Transcript_48090/m.88095 type:complete len:200 (-) Transcript_48090:1157-1756(-)
MWAGLVGASRAVSVRALRKRRPAWPRVVAMVSWWEFASAPSTAERRASVLSCAWTWTARRRSSSNRRRSRRQRAARARIPKSSHSTLPSGVTMASKSYQMATYAQPLVAGMPTSSLCLKCLARRSLTMLGRATIVASSRMARRVQGKATPWLATVPTEASSLCLVRRFSGASLPIPIRICHSRSVPPWSRSTMSRCRTC